MSVDSPAEQRVALAWRELRRGATGAQLRRHLLGPDGPELEQAQMDALEVLAAAEHGLPMSEFADAMHVDPSTATRSIERLERLGLAERFQSDEDRRFVRAHVTSEGARTMRRITLSVDGLPYRIQNSTMTSSPNRASSRSRSRSVWLRVTVSSGLSSRASSQIPR